MAYAPSAPSAPAWPRPLFHLPQRVTLPPAPYFTPHCICNAPDRQICFPSLPLPPSPAAVKAAGDLVLPLGAVPPFRGAVDCRRAMGL